MDGRFAVMKVMNWSHNQFMAPHDEGYGLELEAENCTVASIARAAANLVGLWSVKTDGSLRNNGIEFVSRFLYTNEVEAAISELYRLTRSKWRPSVRSGVHVHVNTLHWTMEELQRFFIAYAFVEPLLYRFCGEHREENIFCVPWYRAPDEPSLLARVFHNSDIGSLRSSCKYSSLYAGPTRSYGTVEFRQAETFATAGEFIRWWKVVCSIAEARKLDNMIELYAQADAAAVARQVLGEHVADLTDDALACIIESSGAVETALMFADPVYKYGEWGSPGRFAITEVAEAQRTTRLRTLTLEEMDDVDRWMVPPEEPIEFEEPEDPEYIDEEEE